MNRRDAIRTGLPNDDRLRTGCAEQPSNKPPSDISETRLVNQTLGRLVDAGCKAVGGSAPIATEAGVSDQFVGMVRRGEKAVTPKLLVTLLMDPDAALAFCTAVCEQHGFSPPVRKRRLNKRETERAVLRNSRQLGLVWRAVCEATARELGADPEDVDAALDEQTEERVGAK